MAWKLATAFVEIGARMNPFRRQMSGVRSEIQSNVQSMSGLLGQLGLGVGGGAMLGGALQIATAAEQSEVAFNVIIKDMEKTKKLLGELNQFSVVTPFEPTEIRRAGQQLVQSNMAIEEVLPNVKMMGDLAAGAGGDINELIGAFVKLKGEGKMTGEVEERFQTQRVMLRGLAEQAGITGAQWVEMRRKGELTFEFIQKMLMDATSAGGTFFNAMKLQSTTAAGLLSTLKGAVIALGEAMGKKLLPAFKWVLATTISWIDKLVALNKATDGFVVQAGAATAALMTLRAAMIAARMAGLSLGKALATALFMTGAGAVLVIIGGVLAGIIKLIGYMVALAKQNDAWEQSVARISVAWERLKEALSIIGERILAAWNAIIDAINERFGTAFGDLEGTVGGFVSQAITWISEMVLNIAEWLLVLVDKWDIVWELIKNSVRIAIQFVRDQFGEFPRYLAWAAGRMLRLWLDVWTTILDFVVKVIIKIGKFMADVFKRVWQGIKNLFKGKSFGEVFQDVFNRMQSEVNKVQEGFASGFAKRNPFADYKPSPAMQAALDKQTELLNQLKDAKREAEIESAGMIAERVGKKKEAEQTTGPPPPSTPDKIIAKKLEVVTGFSALDQLGRQMQENVMKAETKDDQLLKQGDIAQQSRDRQEAALKSIEENTAKPPVETADT